MITGASLFAGIGGFDLAMERAGVDVTVAVEIDKPCQSVLAKHFPHTVLFDDVSKVTCEDILGSGFRPDHGILTAGWPCQGNSVAGRRGGLADPRSGLWSDVHRLLAGLRPRWFVGENVPGLLSVNQGEDFPGLIKSLDELGYGVAWRVLDAQYAGVPQRRRRVIIVGCLGDGASPAEVLFEPESGYRDSAPGRSPREDSAEAVEDSAGIAKCLTSNYRIDAEAETFVPTSVTGDITHTPRAEGADASEDGTGRGTPIVAVPVAMRGREQGSQIEYGNPGDPAYTVRTPGGGSSYPMVAASNAVRRLTPTECERLQGFPDGWTEGQSDSTRYRQLGNAVAVPVVQWVIDRIVKQ